MNTAQDTIVQLNQYPPEKYNVLIPVTSLQVMNNLQKVIVNTVQLDADPNNSKDIYKEKSSGKFAITAVGGMKLAAAANISIIESRSEQPEVCKRCIEMAAKTGTPQSCGNCPHQYDVKYSVTIRVPEPGGGFRKVTESKEIDCTIEKQGMSSDVQFRRFLPHRGSIAEKKAYMRAIRAALGLAAGYELNELKKPFVIAHIVPNLDAPEMKQALISNSLRDMGLLFEAPARQEAIADQATPMALPNNEAEDYNEGDYEASAEPMPQDQTQPDDLPPWEDAPQDNAIRCADCGNEITETKANNGKVWTAEAIKGYSEKQYGRCLCPTCQRKMNRR